MEGAAPVLWSVGEILSVGSKRHFARGDSATYRGFYVEFFPLFISLIKELCSHKLSNL